MKPLLYILLLVSLPMYLSAQMSAGTTGLLNIPTAEMQNDGTFITGANYLPETFTPAMFSYNTGNYYFNITFLPFLELTYRLTLFKMNTSVDANWVGKYTNQDRSFAMRIRVLKERKYLPSVVIGGNDLYTSSTSVSANQYFGSTYLVATKSFVWNESFLKFTFGSAIDVFKRTNNEGLMAGISFVPNVLNELTLMADYDTQSVNIGGSLLLFKHFCIHTFCNNFSDIVAGFSYRINLCETNR